MHRSRFYRNSPIHHNRNDTNSVRFGYNGLSQAARNTYRRTSGTPYSPSHRRPCANFRYGDRSKYVWTANTQSQQQPVLQPPVVQQSQPRPAKPTHTQSQVVKQAPSFQQSIHVSKHVLVKKTNPNYREVPPLSVTALDPEEEIAKDIAEKLKEEKFYLINTVVSILGANKSIKLFSETRKKEANGGILVQNGIRRRTPGGVFLTLLRESSFISQMEVDKIFLEIKRHEIKLKSTDVRDSS